MSSIFAKLRKILSVLYKKNVISIFMRNQVRPRENAHTKICTADSKILFKNVKSYLKIFV